MYKSGEAREFALLCFIALCWFIGHVTAKCSRESVCNLNMCLVLLAPFRFVLLASLLD